MENMPTKKMEMRNEKPPSDSLRDQIGLQTPFQGLNIFNGALSSMPFLDVSRS